MNVKNVLHKKFILYFCLTLVLFILFIIWSGFYQLLYGVALWPVFLLSRLILPRNVQSIFRSNWIKTPLYFIGVIVLAVCFRVFLLGIYTIPSSSMANTLFPGDKILVSKIHYGPKLPKSPLEIPLFNVLFTLKKSWLKQSKNTKWPHKRLNGLSSIERNDIIVFEQPRNHEAYIKRCIGCPGDTLEIQGNQVLSNGSKLPTPETVKYPYALFYDEKDSLQQWATKHGMFLHNYAGKSKPSLAKLTLTQKNYIQLKQEHIVDSIQLFTENNPNLKQYYDNQPNNKRWVRSDDNIKQYNPRNNLFPHTTKNSWSLHYYGPLVVPEKDLEIELTTENGKLYKSVIEKFEGDSVTIDSTHIFINGRKAQTYTFSRNYYFMLGDNRDHSQDSRYWGFVPKTHIIGKAVVVLFSTKWRKLVDGRFFVGLQM